MSFDVALGMDERTLSEVLASLYDRPSLKARIFSGTQQIHEMGISTMVSFEVEAPPVVRLMPPSSDQWNRAIKRDGSAVQPTANAMVVMLPKLKLSRPKSDGTLQEGVISLDAIVTVTIVDQRLSYDALAVVIDLSGATPLDRIIYRKVVIPMALDAVDRAFGQPHIPNIAFRGLSFGPIALQVGDGRVVGIANLAGKPPAGPQPDHALPHEPFFILLSREALQIACQSGTADLVGRTDGTSGSANFGIGTATYEGRVRVDDIAVRVEDDPTTVDVAVAVSASAQAGVDVIDQIWDGIKTGGNAVADAGKTAVDTIGNTAKDVGNTIADTFSSY
jgi:hypothetical protein